METKLKSSFYTVVKTILNKELTITNIGVNKEFNLFVDHLEKVMTHPRIIVQFELACKKYKEGGTETINHFNWIKKDIESRLPNY